MASSAVAMQEDQEAPKINRRRIYLHRLVGDDVFAPRAKSSKQISWRVVLRFIIYAAIAINTILSRSNVYSLSEANLSIERALFHQWFVETPRKRYFMDVETIDDLKLWLGNTLFGQIYTMTPLGDQLSLLGHNRVTSLKGACPDGAAVMMTLRRQGVTTNYKDTTTERFHQLFPVAWIQGAGGTQVGSSSDTETVDAITSKGGISWLHTPKCQGSCSEPFSTQGYRGAGGYVALATVTSSGVFVHLLDNNANVEVDPATGICEGIRRSAVMPLKDFLAANFLDSQFRSLAIRFLSYNANLQTMTGVSIYFARSGAGLILDKNIHPDTIMLDYHDSIARYFDIAYLVLTGCYFFEFMYRMYKYSPSMFYDVWAYVNVVSIVMSLTSLGLWFVYTPEQQEFNQNADFKTLSKFNNVSAEMLWYLRCGAMATLTICLRILKHIGELNSRVRLLLRTLSMCARKMAIYTLYCGVIFLGFVTFAFIKFSARSSSFVDYSAAILTCFEMFLGQTRGIEPLTGDGLFKIPFFVMFMTFFYFVSVQMFNAIINYAYNLCSEQMEPEFEQEKQERKRRELQRLAASKDLIHRAREYVLSFAGKQKPEEAAVAKDAGEHDKRRGPRAADSEERGARLKKEKRKMPDSMCRQVLFFIFAVSYMWFLVVNLRIGSTFEVQSAIRQSIEDTPIIDYRIPRTTLLSWEEMTSLADVSSWIYGSLPIVLFNTTSQQSVEVARAEGIHHPDAVCIRSWNCLVLSGSYPATGFPVNPGFTAPTQVPTSAPANATGNATANATAANGTVNGTANATANGTANSTAGGTAGATVAPQPPPSGPPSPVPQIPPWARPRGMSVVRITQRRSRVVPNRGCTTPDTASDKCFRGGTGNSSTGVMNDNAKIMVPNRMPSTAFSAYSSPWEQEDRDPGYSLQLGGRPFCTSTKDTGLEGNGGIVCLLDADYGTFLQQLKMMYDNQFVQSSSSTFAVDFATYNGNSNMLTHVVITFTGHPGGIIEKTIQISSITLSEFGDFLDEFGSIVVRLLPGVMYILLVFKFAYDLNWDLRQEVYRKKLNENSSWVRASIEFITLDVFNMLEVISIGISLVSFILYILWMVREGQLGTKLDKSSGMDLNSFLDYCVLLTGQARKYSQLSAVNCLLIFIRPLKFVRQSVRFAQLYQTLWDARTDIGWFVFILAIALFGFVMFAYVCFGPYLTEYRNILETFNTLFKFVIGNFDYKPLSRADPLMAVIFFFPYLLIISLVFVNIFFAIIDRYYIPKDPPPVNLKRRLKPIFQRVFRFVEWDEDYVMEQDPNAEKKAGPPSRQSKVKDLVKHISSTAGEHDQSFGPKGSKLLSDVCDTDDRMVEVLHWSREEAAKVVLDFQRLLQRKQAVKNDEVFIKQDVMNHIRDESRSMREDMEAAERLMRYATKVHELMAMRDQETLAKYILILELKIRNRMKQRHELEREVGHLRSESDKMRFTPDELTQQAGAAAVRQSDRWAAEDKDSDDSGEDPAGGASAPGADARPPGRGGGGRA